MQMEESVRCCSLKLKDELGRFIADLRLLLRRSRLFRLLEEEVISIAPRPGESIRKVLGRFDDAQGSIFSLKTGVPSELFDL